jgi:hypothetical protein
LFTPRLARTARWPADVAPYRGGAHDERLGDLQEVTDAALSRLDAYDLLVALLDRVVRIVDADTATVLLLDAATRARSRQALQAPLTVRSVETTTINRLSASRDIFDHSVRGDPP